MSVNQLGQLSVYLAVIIDLSVIVEDFYAISESLFHLYTNNL